MLIFQLLTFVPMKIFNHFWNKVGRFFKLSDRLQFDMPNCQKVVKKIFFNAPKASKSGERQVLVEPTMVLLWRPLDVLLFRRPKKYFFHNFFDSLGY
jgi:hypothetical protein